jgi:hypothetical protein
MTPIIPFWFKQRQCQAEPVGNEQMLKVTGPNLGEFYLRIQQEPDGRWRAAMRSAPDGQDLQQSSGESVDAKAAWQAAFELYRTHLLV